MKDLFDELPDYLAAIQGGKSAKEVKKEILEKYGLSLRDLRQLRW